MKELFFQPKGIYYRINEFSPDKQTLIFVHGLTGSSSAWVEYEKKFEKNYNILSYDLRGHGKSEKFKNYNNYEIGKFSEDIRDLMAHLNIEKSVMVSHSFGTLVALEFLSDNQNMVAASVFLSPFYNPRGRKSTKIMQPLIRLALKFFDFFPYTSKTGVHIDYSKYKNTGDWNARRTIADVRNTSLRVFLCCLSNFCEFSRENFLDKINLPVLLIHGKNDTISSVQNSIVMSNQIKNSSLVLLDNADHIIVLNNFPEVSRAIENFI